MVVAVRHADVGGGLAAVGRAEELHVQDVDGVLLHRIGVDARVVERALAHVAVVVRHLPRRAGIVADVEAAGRFVLDERVDAIAVGARDRDADLAPQARRKAGILGDLRPGVAAVGGLEEAAARAAARHAPRRAAGFPQRREDHVGVLRIDRQVHAAGLFVAEQRAAPGLAAVGRLEDAALRMLVVDLAEHRRVDDVAVGRVHAEARDRLRIAEIRQVIPLLAAVGGLVDAVALDDVAAQLRFTAADVDDVGIRLAHGQRANRRAGDLAVGHRRPVRAAVGRLPGSAAGRAKPVFERPRVAAADGQRPSAARRPNAPPAHAGVERWDRRWFPAGRKPGSSSPGPPPAQTSE